MLKGPQQAIWGSGSPDLRELSALYLSRSVAIRLCNLTKDVPLVGLLEGRHGTVAAQGGSETATNACLGLRP